MCTSILDGEVLCTVAPRVNAKLEAIYKLSGSRKEKLTKYSVNIPVVYSTQGSLNKDYLTRITQQQPILDNYLGDARQRQP
jgi:hypothetical protein